MDHAAKTSKFYPEYGLLHFLMGMALAQKGSSRSAIISLEENLRLFPRFTLAADFLGCLCKMSEQAEKVMNDLTKRDSQQHVSPVCFSVYEAAVSRRTLLARP